jgi:CheY-like chemotaxis protein
MMPSQSIQTSSNVSPSVPVLGETGTRAVRRVLVIDDAQDACEGLALLLELEGYRVESALDGPGGLACAACFEPNVVLLDLAMPHMSGYDVARALRRLPATRNALIVALTGLGEFDDIARSRAAGFDHHQVKPVDVDALLALIDRHFEQVARGGVRGD